MMYALVVRNLSVEYKGNDNKYLIALYGLSFYLNKHETLGIIGESGCGKSTLLHSILRILPKTARYEGEIIFKDMDIFKLPDRKMRMLRGRQIALVPQASMDALDPVSKIGSTMKRILRAHNISHKTRALHAEISPVLEILNLPISILKTYPHTLSGGMKQRIAIAIALLLKPEILLLDEPLTGLDVITQNRLLQYIKNIINNIRLSAIFVTHDIASLIGVANRLAVLYAGNMVEIGQTLDVLERPLHPYTQALITALPSLYNQTPVKPLPGYPPEMYSKPTSCVFYGRCVMAKEECLIQMPKLKEMEKGHAAACHLYD